MSLSDIPFAIAITDLEGWGYVPADFRRLMRLDPKGCIKAVVGGQRVGMTTTVPYGKVGWIGNVIVQPEYRGKGIGNELVEAAIRHLQGEGVETVRLNSYMENVQFYERMGFRGEYENARFTGEVGSGGGDTVSCAPCENLEKVISMDKRVFGANRSRLLSNLLSEFMDTFLCIGGQKIRGYIVGQVNDGFCEIAPWVVDSADASSAKELWLGLRAKLGGRRVAFTVPAKSRLAMTVARWTGLKQGLRTLRMRLGKDAHHGRPEGMIGLAGLDKG